MVAVFFEPDQPVDPFDVTTTSGHGGHAKFSGTFFAAAKGNKIGKVDLYIFSSHFLDVPIL
jgi:hypothetical protein